MTSQKNNLRAFSTISLALFSALAFATAAPGCLAASAGDAESAAEDAESHAPEETGDLEEGFSAATVSEAAANSCSTSAVKGLSFQIIEEGNCIKPGAFAPVVLPSNAIASANVNLFLEQPARDKWLSLLKANPNKTLTVNSMLRTVAQQYLLYNWYQNSRCGISLAARPGNSNHETGLAMDVQEYSSWKSLLQSSGFKWLGSSDPWHFDYVGAGAVSHKGLDILAFQRLWNRNNPKDKIAEDGAWGPSTESRMKKSPPGGFAIGAQCGGQPMAEPTCQAAFVDICGSPHQVAIQWLFEQGLTSGCDAAAKKYCPEATMTRAEMAGFLASALKLPAGPDAFTDDDGNPFEASINAIAAAGITSGCGAGQFCPGANVTRAEMASFLTKAFNLPAGPDAFVDDENSIHEEAINSIAAAGITSGCDAAKQLFCPDNNVTRGQMATFLFHALK